MLFDGRLGRLLVHIGRGLGGRLGIVLRRRIILGVSLARLDRLRRRRLSVMVSALRLSLGLGSSFSGIRMRRSTWTRILCLVSAGWSLMCSDRVRMKLLR